MPFFEKQAKCGAIKKCVDIECLNRKNCHCKKTPEIGKIVECPSNISVELNIVTLDLRLETRQVIINVQSLLNSQDFTGIYRSNSRNDVFAYNAIYYVIMKDEVRNTFYILIIVGTFETPFYFGDAGVRQSTPIPVDGFEIVISDSGFNSLLFDIPFFATTPFALYTNKNKSSINTNAIAVLITTSQQPLQLLTKLRKIHENLYNALQKNTIPSFVEPNKNLSTSTYQEIDYIGPSYSELVTGSRRRNTVDKLHQYLNGPVEYHYDVVDIFSNLTILLTFPLTTIITDKIHRFNFYSTVIISGLKKEWSILNGQHIVSPWYSNFMTPKGWCCPNARKYYLSIYFDTSRLPAYNVNIHGHAKISTIHKQVTATSEYGDLRAAQIDVFFDLEYTTHNIPILDGYFDNINQLLPVRTYKQLLDSSANGTYLELIQNTFRDANYTSAIFYAYPFVSYFNISAFILAKNDLLEPLVLTYPTFDTPVINYLVEETVRYPYFRLVPNAASLSGFVVETFLLPPGQQDPLNSFFSGGIVRDFNFYDLGGLSNFSYPVGLIRPELTGGKRIAYFRLNDETMRDPFNLTFSRANIVVPQTANPLSYYPEKFAILYAGYLQSLNIDALIIDSRVNFGGNALQALYFMSMFGAPRKAWKILTTKTGPDGDIIDSFSEKILSEFGINRVYQGFGDFAFIDFTHTPVIPNPLRNIKVDILISRISASSGDTIVPLFYGDKLNGDVGNGVNVRVFGELNGTLDGANGTNYSPILEKAKLVVDGNIIEISPNTNNSEVRSFYQYLNTCEFSPNYVLEYQPDVLMSFTIEQIQRDVGILPACRRYINPEAPVPQDPTTWKDTYLETAILDIVAESDVHTHAAKSAHKLATNKKQIAKAEKHDPATVREKYEFLKKKINARLTERVESEIENDPEIAAALKKLIPEKLSRKSQ